uniref:Uncharacterized protein n=1 Tax=Nelumbo nucifera TaxID=4432 RepID=A0A822YCM9_NELNU|nr:TPA_asm: hypothetical protein HUJ06_031341 [Nelumbo nucifera]
MILYPIRLGFSLGKSLSLSQLLLFGLLSSWKGRR